MTVVCAVQTLPLWSERYWWGDFLKVKISLFLITNKDSACLFIMTGKRNRLNLIRVLRIQKYLMWYVNWFIFAYFMQFILSDIYFHDFSLKSARQIKHAYKMFIFWSTGVMVPGTWWSSPIGHQYMTLFKLWLTFRGQNRDKNIKG